jgi:hypothetical protein
VSRHPRLGASSEAKVSIWKIVDDLNCLLCGEF